MERQGAAEEQVTHVGTDKGLRGLVLRLPRGTERGGTERDATKGQVPEGGTAAKMDSRPVCTPSPGSSLVGW